MFGWSICIFLESWTNNLAYKVLSFNIMSYDSKRNAMQYKKKSKNLGELW